MPLHSITMFHLFCIYSTESRNNLSYIHHGYNVNFIFMHSSIMSIALSCYLHFNITILSNSQCFNTLKHHNLLNYSGSIGIFTFFLYFTIMSEATMNIYIYSFSHFFLGGGLHSLVILLLEVYLKSKDTKKSVALKMYY